MMQEASFWTAEKDAAAQALWRQGRSAREVARLVGAPSQSAVIGRMWRLGAARPARVAQHNHRVSAYARRAMKAAKWLDGVGNGLCVRPTGPMLAERTLPQQTPVLCAPRPWLSRLEHECAYPVAGDGEMVLSCCNTPSRGGYCEAHRAAMFRKPVDSLAWVEMVCR